MQDDTVKLLAQYLTEKTVLEHVEFVENREYGINGKPFNAYIRLELDRDTRDYFRDGDFIVGNYVLVADVTGKKTLSDIILALSAFTKGMIQWREASVKSDVIYERETGEKLTSQCDYILISFELRTLFNCTALC
jgi:hypothetical protein